MPRDLRLEQVLEEAAALFAQEGNAASMDELARRVGVSKPVVYDLIGSKDHLVALLTERLASGLQHRVLDAVALHSDPEGRLRAGVGAFFGFVEEHRSRWVVLGRTGSSALGAALDEVRTRQSSVVVALLADDLRGDGGREPARLDALAHGLNGALEAMASWWLEHPEVDHDELTGLATAFLGPGLRSFADPGHPDRSRDAGHR